MQFLSFDVFEMYKHRFVCECLVCDVRFGLFNACAPNVRDETQNGVFVCMRMHSGVYIYFAHLQTYEHNKYDWTTTCTFRA